MLFKYFRITSNNFSLNLSTYLSMSIPQFKNLNFHTKRMFVGEPEQIPRVITTVKFDAELKCDRSPGMVLLVATYITGTK